jgi:hypothetical protein
MISTSIPKSNTKKNFEWGKNWALKIHMDLSEILQIKLKGDYLTYS